MNLPIFFSVLIAIKGLSFLVSWIKTRGVASQEDYYLAGRSMTFFPLTLTLMAAVLGGGSILGSSEEAFKYGWSFLLYPIGFCLGFIMIGMGAGRKFHSLKLTTIAQIYEVIYNSIHLKQIASVLSIISLYLILVIQIIASKKFLIAIGIDNPLIFFIFWSAVFFHTVIKGFKAVVASHVVKTLFLILVLISVFLITLYKNPDILAVSKSISFIKSEELKLSKMIGWLFMPAFFFLISQDISQRCFAAKSSSVVIPATISAGFTLFLLMTISVFFGIIAGALQLPHEIGASILMTTISWATNPCITAIAGSAFIAAITSSADSLLNATSSNICNDFSLDQYFSSSRITKWISLLIASSSLAFGWYYTHIIDIVIISYEILICTLFASIFIALFSKKGNAQSALYSILAGGGSLIYFRLIMTFPPAGYQLICLAFSLLAFWIGEYQLKFLRN